jgi:catechol 2,3-dioxygenase-like lactoylglutathione lyase family enzyme
MRIAALSVIVPSYAAGLAFYQGVMGFTVTANVDQGRKRWVTVAPPGGGCQIVLARADDATQRAAIGAQGAGRVWLFLQTDDFAADHARMLAAGVQFEEQPRVEDYGTVAIWRDPFGNRWDLIQYSVPSG